LSDLRLPPALLEEWMRSYYFEAEIDIGSSGVEDYSLGELRGLLGISRVGAYLVWDVAFGELTYEQPPLPSPGLLYERAISMGTLSNRIRPEVISIRPVIIFMVVDLPEPFGPK